MSRIRRELIDLCGLNHFFGLDIIFAASGTDAHLIASQLICNEKSPSLVITVEGTETGSGVPYALNGTHFSDCSAFSMLVPIGEKLDHGKAIKVANVLSRGPDGTPRSREAVDRDVEVLVADAVANGQKVLLTLTDLSKTGLIAPSPECAIALRNRFSESVEVLVDACQFRISSSTIQAYLEQDFIVAITGSKFLTGPTFSGALLVPKEPAQRLRSRPVPHALKAYSAKGDWPIGWAAREMLPAIDNIGLLLRWEAALSELRMFSSLPQTEVQSFFKLFADTVLRRLSSDPTFRELPTPVPDRQTISDSVGWDNTPTIFPFLLRRHDGSWLSREETSRVYELLREDLGNLYGNSFSDASRGILAKRCQVGQPVNVGIQDGIPVSALRLCASARLASEALSANGRGKEAILSDALAVLDKTAKLVHFNLT